MDLKTGGGIGDCRRHLGRMPGEIYREVYTGFNGPALLRPVAGVAAGWRGFRGLMTVVLGHHAGRRLRGLGDQRRTGRGDQGDDERERGELY